jgi:outer membrane protein, multidrug efflux system
MSARVRGRSNGRTLQAATLALALGACATYAPLPLPHHGDLAESAAPSGPRPLDMNALATLAVLNNPDLKAARARLNVAQAQAFAAGLLPDPQFSGTSDHPTDRVTSGDPRYPEYSAYSAGLTLDLRALLTHSSVHAAADAAYEQARLDLLWQEWQTVAQARVVYVQRTLAAERQSLLAQAEQTYATASSRSQRALQAGDVALDQASGDLAVLNDIRTQLGAAERNALQADEALHALLGIRPAVPVPLQPLTTPEVPDRAAVEAAVERMPRARPDLRALQAGYCSQESLLRKAVLSQFPNLSVGVTRARDASAVHSTGVGVSMTLPVFERGRGDVAIQRATRAQLRAEYEARLDQAVADSWLLWGEIEQLRPELRGLDERLPRLQGSADSARQAFEAGDLPTATYVLLLNSYLAARASRFDLTQSLWRDSIALATVLGTQLQPVPGK